MKQRSSLQRVVLSLASLFLLFTPGCKTLEKIVGSVEKPTASISGIHLRDLSMDAVTLLFDVDVTNPYGVPLPMVNMDYSLASSDQRFLTGQADIQDTVPANGTKTVSLPAQVSFLETLRVLRQFKPGTVIPYKADLGLAVDAPGVGPLRLPLSKAGQLPIPTVPDVRLQEIKWQELSLDSVAGILRVQVVNRNEFPMDLSSLSYALSLAGTRVASAGIQQAASFAEKGGAATLEIPISFSARSLGLALFQVLAGEEATYMFDGMMQADTPFGPIPFPLESKGNVPLRR